MNAKEKITLVPIRVKESEPPDRDNRLPRSSIPSSLRTGSHSYASSTKEGASPFKFFLILGLVFAGLTIPTLIYLDQLPGYSSDFQAWYWVNGEWFRSLFHFIETHRIVLLTINSAGLGLGIAILLLHMYKLYYDHDPFYEPPKELMIGNMVATGCDFALVVAPYLFLTIFWATVLTIFILFLTGAARGGY